MTCRITPWGKNILTTEGYEEDKIQEAMEW